MAAFLEARSLTKHYPGVRALDDVSLRLDSGKVRGLVGENGAGKSTLIKVLAGVVQANAGEVLIDGERADLRAPQDAVRSGIAVVHQHSHLIPDLSIAENHALRRGYARHGPGLIAWHAMARRAEKAVSLLLPQLDVRRPARTLSDVEKQLVEIGFALRASPRVLILDEPTAALPRHETELLFDRIRHLAADGTAVLFVTHRLDEVLRITDDITVFRDGRHVWTRPTIEVDHDEIIRGMVGRSVSFEGDPDSHPEDDIAFELDGLSDASGDYENVSLSLRRGEIYGIYGLVGAGQSELCQGLFGLRDVVDAQRTRPDAKLAYVPADRHTTGIFHQMSVGENLSIASLRALSRGGTLDLAAERAEIKTQMQDLLVKARGPAQPVAELSGGNQQKVLLGRGLMTKPEVLVLEEPTQGVDVGAKGQIHDLIRELARSGVAVILVSSELPELLALAHRIAVMREGRVVREFDAADVSEDVLLRESLPEAQAESGAAAVSTGPEVSAWKRGYHWLAARPEASMAVFMVVMGSLFALWVPGFATLENLRDVMLGNTVVLIGALGVTLVILAGGIDISLGAVLGVAAVAASRAALEGWNTLIVVTVALASGALLGAINGGLTVLGRVHSIVITLGTMQVFRAVVHFVADREQLNNLPSQLTWVPRDIGGVPVLLAIGLVVVLGVHWFLTYTTTGRRLYVLGGSRESAAYLGVVPWRVLPVAFALCGLLVGLAGLLRAGRMGQVQVSVGEGFELEAIAAAVIGGAHIMGGRGSAIGTFLGVLFLGLVVNARVLLKMDPEWDKAVFGVMILIAVASEALRARLRRGEE